MPQSQKSPSGSLDGFVVPPGENAGDVPTWNGKDYVPVPGGGSGTVFSVFSRVGAVVAAAGDYVASQINNDSSVPGVTVKAALNALLAAIPAFPVASVFSRTGSVVAVAGDYAASLITNNSSVAGSTVKDALNTLLAAIPSVNVTSVFSRSGAVVATLGDYAASLVTNNSSVTGATVKDALNTLLAAIPSVPVSSVFSRTGAIVAMAGDYGSDKITNQSGVAGSTVSDALDALAGGSGSVEINNGNAGSAQAIDFTTSPFQLSTLNAASAAFTYTPPASVGHVQHRIQQDGSGGHAFTLPAGVKWLAPTPTWNTGAGKVSTLNFYWDGTTFWVMGGTEQ